MSEVELGKRLERPTFTPYTDIDLFEAETSRAAKAKSIIPSRATKGRSDIYIYPHAPVQNVEIVYDEELGAFVDRRISNEVCPVCGAEVIHESGCLRCTCGWSAC